MILLLFTKLLNRRNQSTILSIKEQIKATAKEIFFYNGNLHTPTQEIAVGAIVIRSLINDYFHSRDQLFKTVYNEAVETMRPQLNIVIYSTFTFKDKLTTLIEAHMTEIVKYLHKESFLITERCSKNFLLKERKKDSSLIAYLEESNIAMEKGSIRKSNAIHFIMKLFSLMAYPEMMTLFIESFLILIKKNLKVC
ncbi:MAG: TetR/AcrR family transcriptional regulator [Sphingobacteriales bacterium]|nr:TetR/AcrR family transcriptional regulator [Sphingobacteriales bacterium]